MRRKEDVYAAVVFAPSAIDSHIVNINSGKETTTSKHNTAEISSDDHQMQSQSRDAEHEIEIPNFYWLTASQNDASTIELKWRFSLILPSAFLFDH